MKKLFLVAAFAATATATFAQTALPSFAKDPAIKNAAGKTCAVFDGANNKLADFLNASQNPDKVVVTSGRECQERQEKFKKTVS